MGELRGKRPTTVGMPELGRGGGDDRLHRADEESLREEQARLRTQLAALRREGAEAKERLRAAERDSARKDKLLQELLAAAKCGTGVPAEALDQLREDLQALLQVKRRSQDARQQLDEKELKILSIQQELKSTSLLDMEEDVAAAKMECKAKATEWAEANSGADTHCFAESQQHQKAARHLFQKIVDVENEISKSQQRLVTLQDERTQLEVAAKEHEDQVTQLAEKRQEIERQKEQCEQRLDGLGDVEDEYARMKSSVDDLSQKLTEAKREAIASELRVSALQGKSPTGQTNITAVDWKIDHRLLEPGFRPLASNSSESLLLLQLLRIASQQRISLIKVMRAEDSDGDGRITAPELSRVMQRLASLTGAVSSDADLSESAAARFMASLSPGLAPETASPRSKESKAGSVAIADLVVALPMQPPAEPSGPSEAELMSASKALSWACRRCSMPEREVRRRVAVCLQPPDMDRTATASPPASPSSSATKSMVAEMTRLGQEVGLTADESAVLGKGLEARRERLAPLLPSWRCLADKSQAALLVRFVHDLTKFRDTLLPQLGDKPLELEAFLKVGQELGPHWSVEDLEEIALLAEHEAARDEARCHPPVVDAARLARAVLPGGLAAQFPLTRSCLPDALAACEAAARNPSRRMPASLPDQGLGSRSPPGKSPKKAPSAHTSPAKASKAPGSPEAPRAPPAPPAPDEEEQEYSEDDFQDESDAEEFDEEASGDEDEDEDA